MTFADNFQCIMRGGVVYLELTDLFFFVTKMSEFGINTLMIQQTIDEKYACAVDKQTVEAFIERFPIAPPYKTEEGQI